MSDQEIYDAVRQTSRCRLQKIIEELGGAAYDDEPLEDIVESVAEDIISGEADISILGEGE